MSASKRGHLEIFKNLIEVDANIYKKNKFSKTALIYVGESLSNSKEKDEKDEFIEMASIIIRRIAEDYIHLFISLNKDITTPQSIRDSVHAHIKLLYSLQELPIEIFEKIITMIN